MVHLSLRSQKLAAALTAVPLARLSQSIAERSMVE
jgi:hypothetical protein